MNGLPDCEVVMVTGHATVPIAVEAMQKGAFNFLEKPITPNRLRAIAEKAVGGGRVSGDKIRSCMQRLDERFGFEGIIYTSKKMQTVIDRLRRIARDRRHRADHRRKRDGQRNDRSGDSSKQSSSQQTDRRAEHPRGCPKIWSKANCSATSKDPSPTRWATAWVRLNTPTAVRCFWMKSATCR